MYKQSVFIVDQVQHSEMVTQCMATYRQEAVKRLVVACEPAECKIKNEKGNLAKKSGYFVELEDTILFPEGGGQPDDYGTINNVDVKRVIRKGAKALHFVCERLTVGDNVELLVDWTRRFDHMQQHSAQHLITAIADDEYGFKTTSWDLGRSVSYIEMDTSQVTSEQLTNIENLVNQAIRDHIAVEVHVTHVSSPLLDGVRARGLPDDHVGDVRIVEMKGIEANMCCGTHVSNLAHLQAIKLLSAEKGKKGKTNVYFLAGNRLLNYTEKSYACGKEFTKHLKCGSDEHVAMLEKSMNQLKVSTKSTTNLLRRVALLEAQNIKDQCAKESKLISLHQKEGNVEFMNIIANEVGTEIHLFLTVGNEKGQGMFLLSGPPAFISSCAATVADMIGGKGMTKDTRMQGKADKLQKKQQATNLCEEYMKGL